MKNKKIIIITLITLTVLLISLLIFKYYKDSNKLSKNKKEEIKEKIKFENNEYTLLINDNAKINDKIYYKLNNNYEVTIVIKDTDEYYNKYEIYINNNFLLEDENYNDNEIVFNVIKGNLAYLNTGYTDIRRKELYIIEKDNTIHNIYQLDNIIGMVPKNITLNHDNIIIEGTRFHHGPSIIYDKADINDALLEDSTTWSKYGITKNTIIRATYEFNFDSNNKLITTPIISNETTIEEDLIENPID